VTVIQTATTGHEVKTNHKTVIELAIELIRVIGAKRANQQLERSFKSAHWQACRTANTTISPPQMHLHADRANRLTDQLAPKHQFDNGRRHDHQTRAPDTLSLSLTPRTPIPTAILVRIYRIQCLHLLTFQRDSYPLLATSRNATWPFPRLNTQ